MLRYLSSVDLHRAWIALDGDPGAADFDALDGVATDASHAALHAMAAALLVAIVRRRPFGDRSDYMALVAADLAYQANGWALPADQSDVFDDLVQQVAAGSVSPPAAAEALAAFARPAA